MNKSALITILAIGLIAVAGGATVGMIYAFSPNPDTELKIVSITTQSITDEVTVVLTCESNETGQQNQYKNSFRRHFAYMHQFQFNNSDNSETMYQHQIQNKWQHKVQAGKNMMFQFQIEGLEQGQMLMLKIEYNNGKMLIYQFQVKT